MRIGKEVAAVVVLVIVGLASLAVYETYPGGEPSCFSVQPGGVKNEASETTFGPVTEYKLPGQNRWPNAVTYAPDGSVWFVEQELPGVAHLYPVNGTVVEYAWSGFVKPKLPDCVPLVSSSGIALWNGRVWAADEFGNALVGVSPRDGSVETINTSAKAAFPYWLAVGPGGELWFTSDSLPATLGKVQTNMAFSTVSILGLGTEQPLWLEFVNSTLAYLSTIDQATNSTTHSCQCTGHIYSFDPSAAATSLTPQRVGGAHRLVLPTSVSYADGSLWVTQHGGSSLAGYNITSGVWTALPTSLVSWSDATLPLEVEGSGGRVWFNEHIANKIALLDPAAGTLTEFSESNPPASTDSGIQNDLSISATSSGLWFTSMSGNYVGFIDGTKDPGIHVAAQGANRASAAPGGEASFTLRVSGTWAESLAVNSSDSENPQSIPGLIRAVTNSTTIPESSGAPAYLGVKVEVSSSALPGSYTVAITFTAGTIQQTAYLFIVVT